MSPPKLIDISKKFEDSPTRRKLFQASLQKPIEAILGVNGINSIYQRSVEIVEKAPATNHFRALLEAQNIDYTITHGSIENIPTSGPVILVANHPFGGVDGIILGDLMKTCRPDDARLMGNFLLKHIPLIADDIISVNPFGSRQATKENGTGLRETLKWLRQGHCLAAFPAGIVAHYQLKHRRVIESEWHYSLASIAQKTKATVVPLHFEGVNSRLFHLMGILHPRLRTATLMREVNNKHGQTISLRIGKPISPKTSAAYEDTRQLAKFYQLRSQILRQKVTPLAEEACSHASPEQKDTSEAIAPRLETADLLDELAQLPAEAMLAEQGVFRVYVAKAAQIPQILHEIGRTRELTFRPIGEGTGKPLDLDVFDQHYYHLFLWNSETCEIVGAYRIGKVDEILSEHGYAGLYSSTIFDYRDDPFASLGKTLELGRSYIVPSYQRKGTSLFLLWRGIIRFVLKNPGYNKLFGAVSISDDYQPLSKALILKFLRNHKMLDGFQKKIRAHREPKFEKLKSLKAFDYPEALPRIDNLSSLVEEIEPDAKGIPTLLKHYLQLNGVILGFGVDQAFSDALDGFILVDLEKVDPQMVAKYSGIKGASVVAS